MRTLLSITCAVVLFCCASLAAKPLTSGEGYLNTPHGKIWYHIYGSGSATPMLVLHGGPGIPSNYLKPLAGLSNDRPVILFDQLGVGKSATPDDTTQWTIPNFVAQIDLVRKALGLEKVHLYGHSWGTMLAVDYLLSKPSGVVSCILAGPALSVPLWIKGTDSLLKTLPDSVQQVIRKNEAAGTFDSPDYQGAMMMFYGEYLARKQPWSADTDSSFAGINANMYGYMQGPSEFTIVGTIKDYDRTKELGQIKVPTLVIVGQYDESVPSNAKYYQSLIPGSQLEIVPNAAHLAMQDDSAAYVGALRTFINSVDNKK